MTAQSVPKHSIAKRIIGTSKSLRKNGFGRTIIKINTKYKFTSDYKARRLIKLFKKIFSPMDMLQRFSMARKLQRHSAYADFVSKKMGYQAMKLSDIPEASKAITSCREYLEKLNPKIQSLVGQETFIHPLQEEHSDYTGIAKAGIYNLRDIPGLTELMLSPTMIEMASCYLGEVPVVASVVLYISLPNDTMIGSQMYHSDAEDFRQVQFIFAITDIEEDCGPFTLIPADKSKPILDERYARSTVGRLSDEDVYDVVGGSDAKIKLLGSAGSCWAVDTTRCLHYGSRGNNKVRCHLQIQFVSRFSPAEPLFHFSGVNASVSDKLSKLQKMVAAKIKFVASA